MKDSIPLLVLVVLISAQSFAGKYNAILNIDDPMPSFKNLPATDGSTLSSSDIKASIVVMVSLANSCPWVQGLDPGLVSMADKLKDEDVRIVGFAVNHSKGDRLPAMKEHAEKAGYPFTYIYDESQELGRQLGATRTPEYFVFDRNRKLVYTGLLHDSPARKKRDGSINHINGEPTAFYVENAVTALQSNSAVDPAETRAHGCSVKYVNRS